MMLTWNIHLGLEAPKTPKALSDTSSERQLQSAPKRGIIEPRESLGDTNGGCKTHTQL